MKNFKPYHFFIILLAVLFVISCNIEPYEGDIPEESSNPTPNTCAEAIQNTAVATSNLAAATESNYADMCNDYKMALQGQIDACGDEGGLIQIIIDGLGDCSVSNAQDDCETAVSTTNLVLELFNLAADENYSDSCNVYKAALQSQIDICGDDGTLQTIIDGLGNCTQENSVADEHAFMTANMNGEQFNDMKPNGYLFFGESVDVNGFFTRDDDDYLIIQGNSGYGAPLTINVTDKEINLNIPSALWEEGTFDLYNEATDVDSPVIYYTFFIYTEPENYYKNNLMGEITIKKFDLTERFIQGTFEFEYEFVSQIDGSILGPYKVTGTFDYALDDEFFD